MSDDTRHHADEHPHAARIRERAYLIWENDGRPDGHALAHWARAREEIEAEVAREQAEAPAKDKPAR
ncbi:DUF2934 domain-containing protein [Aestuariivirga sp.]|uniref:DUF2934 domain-containing protein n=1 Tax=Aestuariivirga sp. TaxID=2650926 RepID=UPI0035B266B9